MSEPEMPNLTPQESTLAPDELFAVCAKDPDGRPHIVCMQNAMGGPPTPVIVGRYFVNRVLLEIGQAAARIGQKIPRLYLIKYSRGEDCTMDFAPKPSDVFVGKKNIYTCPMEHQTITIDKDEGVTPFMIGCKHPGCSLPAQSAFYRVDPITSGPATHEWYKPDIVEIKTLEGKDQILGHIRQGGLLLREIQ